MTQPFTNINTLQKLIQLRGVSIRIIAETTGYGYHNVQKIIKRATRPTKSGGVVRSNHKIETAIAGFFGLTHEECWGKDSDQVLKRLIRKEITARASDKASQFREIYL